MATKVTINHDKTPSDVLIEQAKSEITVTDAMGRTITLKKPGVLAQYRLIEILGESARNEVYMGMVLPLIYVAGMDGDAVMQPSSKREVEALIQRLDESGIAAVMQGVQDNFGASTPDEDKEKLKK